MQPWKAHPGSRATRAWPAPRSNWMPRAWNCNRPCSKLPIHPPCSACCNGPMRSRINCATSRNKPAKDTRTMKTARYLLLLSLLPGGASADTPLDLHHAAAPTAHVTVNNVKGSVNIVAWDRNEVHVGGQLGDGAAPLAIEGSDNNLTINVQAKGHEGWFNWSGENAMEPTTLDVSVPRAVSVKVSVVSAPLSIDGIKGGDI